MYPEPTALCIPCTERSEHLSQCCYALSAVLSTLPELVCSPPFPTRPVIGVPQAGAKCQAGQMQPPLPLEASHSLSTYIHFLTLCAVYLLGRVVHPNILLQYLLQGFAHTGIE